MGNSNSRIDKNYGNYEKSFDRIQIDTERINSRTALRARRKANLRMWCWALVALAIGVAAAIIHKVGPLSNNISSDISPAGDQLPPIYCICCRCSSNRRAL